MLPYIYEQVPPDDELAVLFTDFRYDDLFGSGPGSGPLSVPIQGIGDWQANPRSWIGARVGEPAVRGQHALYIGGPTVQPSPASMDGYEYQRPCPRSPTTPRTSSSIAGPPICGFSDPRSGRIERPDG